jgi:hypothetical protein
VEGHSKREDFKLVSNPLQEIVFFPFWFRSFISKQKLAVVHKTDSVPFYLGNANRIACEAFEHQINVLRGCLKTALIWPPVVTGLPRLGFTGVAE